MDDVDLENLREDFDLLFNPEEAPPGPPTGDIPHERLEKVHGLDL